MLKQISDKYNKNYCTKYNKNYEKNILELLESIKDLDFTIGIGGIKNITYNESNYKYSITIYFKNTGEFLDLFINKQIEDAYGIDFDCIVHISHIETDIINNKKINQIIKELYNKYLINYKFKDIIIPLNKE